MILFADVLQLGQEIGLAEFLIEFQAENRPQLLQS